MFDQEEWQKMSSNSAVDIGLKKEEKIDANFENLLAWSAIFHPILGDQHRKKMPCITRRTL